MQYTHKQQHIHVPPSAPTPPGATRCRQVCAKSVHACWPTTTLRTASRPPLSHTPSLTLTFHTSYKLKHKLKGRDTLSAWYQPAHCAAVQVSPMPSKSAAALNKERASEGIGAECKAPPREMKIFFEQMRGGCRRKRWPKRAVKARTQRRGPLINPIAQQSARSSCKSSRGTLPHLRRQCCGHACRPCLPPGFARTACMKHASRRAAPCATRTAASRQLRSHSSVMHRCRRRGCCGRCAPRLMPS